ncbi:MAG: hypothetical protein M3296_02155 [Actinomycetota bacterium]|nr:hypothetical protein [Actinomycetota bacterium]
MTAPASLATSASTELNLNGGDKLVSNAWHCSTYWNHCSWVTSAKLKGNTPRNAVWIQNGATIQGHGPSVSIALDPKSVNVEIVFKAKTLIRTRWRNSRTWISWSSSRVSPSKSTAWVSTQSSATAYHPRFGHPGPLVAYAGAF